MWQEHKLFLALLVGFVAVSIAYAQKPKETPESEDHKDWYLVKVFLGAFSVALVALILADPGNQQDQMMKNMYGGEPDF